MNIYESGYLRKYIFIYIYIFICLHVRSQNFGPDPFEVSDANTMLSYLKSKM
jgi:hypothetical protein